MNRKYEIGFIINPEATEEEVKKIIDNLVDIVKAAQGVVENIDEWGRRKMSYTIDKHNEGIYVFINTDMPGHVFFQLERRLKLTEKVMRYVIIRLDDKLQKANRLTKKWKRMEKMSRRNQEMRDDIPEEEDSEVEVKDEE